jgi:hypothetical protein
VHIDISIVGDKVYGLSKPADGTLPVSVSVSPSDSDSESVTILL